MSDDQLARIERTLGRLEADTEEGKKQRSAIYRKLDEIKDELAPVAQLQIEVKRIAPLVDKHEGESHRQQGMVAVISGAVAIGATLAVTFIKGIFQRGTGT